MKYAIWITDATLVRALQARAVGDQRKISAVADRALRAYLHLKHQSLHVPIADAANPSAKTSGRCHRCQHSKTQHWARGCVAGCACPKWMR